MAAETENDQKLGTKRFARLFGYFFLFLASFFIFVYLTFPYEVLKESLAADLSQSTGYAIRVGDLSPALPLGIRAENIQIEAPGGAAVLHLASARARLTLHKLFLGKVSPSFELEAGKGNFRVDANFSILDLLKSQFIPRQLSLYAKDFPLDEFMAFGLGVAANGPGANPMLAPIISVIGVSAIMQAKSEFDLDLKNPTLSHGFADITLKNAVLKLDHPTLGLPNQEFKKAGIKATVEGGSVVIDKSSGLVAEELDILMNGKVALRPNPMSSQLDLNMEIALNKGLKEKFGFIIDAMTGSATSEGKLTMQVRGALEEPSVTMF
jgi:type II secretion system protein N